MSFFKELGELVGTVVGGVVGGTTEIIGDIVDSDFVREVGKDVYRVSSNAGKTVGQAADGVTGVAKGIITQDIHAVDDGIEELGDAVGRTVVGMVKGVGYVAENGIDTLEGVINGDTDQVIEGAKNIAKVAAVATLAVGTGDYLGIIGDDFDGVDHVAHMEHGIDIDGDGIVDVYDGHDVPNAEDMDTSEIHHVKPHYVQGHMRNGHYIEGHWRDGDGNTNINLTEENGGGYIRTNPDGNSYNNLG
ncbi:hypothetical protein [Anaeromicrobium sediminis]|uniref:Uncharacterized protein n=1 Tax=Anaeromicrobium sediminis TaxID=1478221 RepID=A0A267MKU4_9FIRM|nr:hypothetical protein [Anaeromicrobium sediminis]PAB60214.1 hypothetical protein CCE28_04760 [Anaeromicrobium sediminis]